MPFSPPRTETVAVATTTNDLIGFRIETNRRKHKFRDARANDWGCCATSKSLSVTILTRVSARIEEGTMELHIQSTTEIKYETPQ